jgi:hypothetical protein
MICAADSDCRAGRMCQGGFCVDGPPLDQINSCYTQLIPYNVAAGGSYLVSGSVNGTFVNGTTDANGNCMPDPNNPPRVVSRIPLSAPMCTNVHPLPDDPNDKGAFFDSTNAPIDPTGKPVPDDRQPLNWIKTPLPAPNPCLFVGGRNASDTDSAATGQERHLRALFQNTQVSFVITNVEWEPSAGLQLQFDVSGGARPQTVAYPPTVEVSAPARIVLGPIDSQPQTTTSSPADFEAPYLFVVDQRRLGRAQGGGPTRGQLVRINPIGFAATIGSVTGVQPIYDDYTRSGGLFPIQ